MLNSYGDAVAMGPCDEHCSASDVLFWKALGKVALIVRGTVECVVMSKGTVRDSKESVDS